MRHRRGIDLVAQPFPQSDAPQPAPALPAAGGRVMTLGDFKLPVIRIDCFICDRHGRYDRDRAIARHGADMPLGQFFRSVVRSSNPDQPRHRCAAGCHDLLYMNSPAPFTDGFK